MIEQIYTNYPAFIKSAQELRNLKENYQVQSLNRCDEALVNLKSKLDTILGEIPTLKKFNNTEDGYQYWQDLPDEVDIFLTEKNYSE